MILSPTNTQLLETKLNAALAQPTSLSVVQAYEAEENAVIRQFLGQMIDGRKFEAKLDELNQKQSHRIVCETQEDFIFCLGHIGMSKEEKAEIEAQERSKYQAALKQGLKARFALTFYEEAGKTFVIPATQIEVDPSLP